MAFSKSKFIVVTGAAGFIASCVVKHLNELGYDRLILVDQLGSDDRWMNLVGKRFVDLLPKENFHHWVAAHALDIGAIIHLGACSDTTESNADFLLENNYRYTLRLAEIALEHNIRFIYASSAASYGDGSKGFSDDHELLESLQPLNMYGYSKHLFDLWAKRHGALDTIVGLKYFNVFGPNEGHKGRMASVVVKMLPQIQKESCVRLFKSSEPQKYADGGQLRDFIYVKDAARMTCQFLFNDVGGIFNIGTGQARSWNDLAKSVFSALELEPSIEYIDMPTDLLGKYQNYTCADMAKYHSCSELDGQTLPLEESVKDYIQEHLLVERSW